MDARKQNRTPLIYTLKVENQRMGEILGYVVNIDPEGMMLLSDREPELRIEPSLCIHLPKNVMGGGCVDASGEVVWFRREEEGKFHVGVKFDQVPESALNRLTELINRFYQPERSSIESVDPYLQNTDPDEIT